MSAASKDTAAVGNGRARTIVYVHGIGNKPPPDILKCQWDEALFGFNLGERSRLAYWVNRIFYPEATVATCKMPDSTHETGSLDGGSVGARALASGSVDALLPRDMDSEKQRAILEKLAQHALAERDLSGVSAADFHAKVLPLPKPIREFVSRRITKAWLKDVNEFLFVKERRDAMRRSVLDRLATGGGPFIVIAHSQGSMVAYDALCSFAPGEIEVDLFVTIGSPLGLKEVQDQIKVFTNQPKGLATPAVVKRWVNVADPLDPVCADKRLRSDYAATNGIRVEDFLRFNEDSPRDPHSATGYLGLPAVRGPVREAIDLTLFQRIAPFTISRDLANDLEKFSPTERHTVLIELRDEFPQGEPRTLDDVRAEVVKWIDREIAKADPPLNREGVELEDTLNSYVSVKLTRSEVERMSAELGDFGSVYRVFRNARKRALLDQSIDVLQCSTAHRGYESRGQGITWAVLDTGIDPDHPHFEAGANIAAVYDCMKSGAIRERDPKKAPDVGYDGNGHGTHVAGIIAGGMPAPVNVCGIAPAVKLWSYKVLDDEGGGSDAKIIKALDHIYEKNRTSSSLVVHGVNLSLGGPFDPEAFGCGDTPICKQLRKLWRQGVVVVLAAGNEGYLELQQGDEVYGVNTDLSIGDPANLDESIAVGSIHKSKPHLYGVSYFSSRGPTADGRPKPDLVAPGERILSCRAGANPRTRRKNNLYVTMSGTSMAAPHVSGVIACFLSVRKEFIGYPDRVKKILLDACTDLNRDRLHQGAGMPNLVKMLLGT